MLITGSYWLRLSILHLLSLALALALALALVFFWLPYICAIITVKEYSSKSI
jgi:hypothetical protein